MKYNNFSYNQDDCVIYMSFVVKDGENLIWLEDDTALQYGYQLKWKMEHYMAWFNLAYVRTFKRGVFIIVDRVLDYTYDEATLTRIGKLYERGVYEYSYV